MIAELFDRHGEESDGNLLTGSQQHILLASVCLGVDFHLFVNKNVGEVALSGYDYDNVVAFRVGVGDDFRHVHHAFGVGNRGAAEFLND